MIDCERSRALMLEAEPQELAGEGTGALARHLATCPRCGEIAAAILRDTRGLGAALEAAAGAPDVEGILERAADTAGDAPRLPRSRTGRWVAWSTLAAAAATAAVLLGRPDAPLPPPATRVADAAPPALQVDTEQNVAVIPTGNPDITVLWFF